MADPKRGDYLKSRFMDDAILQQVTSLGVAPDAHVANLARSGQLGTGIRFTKLDGATPAVFNPAVGVVLSVPSMWNPWPKMQEMLRAIMETHCKSITGIDFGYELETADTIVGHDGQTLKVPTRTTRGAVNPSATIQEYPGMPVYNLFRMWQFDIQHPDTNSSLLPAINSNVDTIPAWYMSAYSMSMLFIQFDPTGLPDRIYDACVITNMFPTSIGDIGFERTLGTTQLKERSINFTGLVQHNENTRELGYRVAQLLQMHKINYNYALPGLAGSVSVGDAIDPDIRPFGGLEFEAGKNEYDSKAYEGSIHQFNPLYSDGEYKDINRRSDGDYKGPGGTGSNTDIITRLDKESAKSSGSNIKHSAEALQSTNLADDGTGIRQ